MSRTIQWMISFLLVLVARTAFAACIRDIDCPGELVCVDGECAPSAADNVPAPAPTKTDEPVTETVPQDSAVMASPAPAPGACMKDVDCKGDRICQDGACVDAEAAPALKAEAAPTPVTPPPVSAPKAYRPVRKADDGWALGGAVAGFVAMAPVTVFSTLSIINLEYTNPAIPFGATALTFVMSIGPLVHASGASARKNGVHGSLGLRIPAWILYGFTIGVGISLLAVGLADGVDVHIWQIALAMSMGDVSLGLFAADALIARTQARRLMRQQQVEPSAPPLALSPTFSPVIGPTGTTGGIVGLGGSF